MSDDFDLSADHVSGLRKAEEFADVIGLRNSLPDKATMDALREQQKMRESVYGAVGTSMADAVESFRGLRGIDDGMFASLNAHLKQRDTASAILEEEILKAKRRDVLGMSEADTFNRHVPPELPPLPRNPLIETNELLSDVSSLLTEQRAMVAASAQAQEQGTQLIGQLVNAYVSSQKAADVHASNQQKMSWISIGIAIVSAIVAFVAIIPMVVSLMG